MGREFFICEDAVFVTPFILDLYSVTLFLPTSSNTAYSLSGIGRFDEILLCPHEDGQEQRLSSASIKFLWLRQIHDPSGISPVLDNALSTLLSCCSQHFFPVHVLASFIRENEGNSRMTWRIINELTSRKIHNSSLKEIKLDNNSISDPQELSSAFNDHFSSIRLKLINAIQKNGDAPSYKKIMLGRPNTDSNSKPLTAQQLFLYYLNFVNLKRRVGTTFSRMC